jgi:hypothetical protein
MIKPIPLGRDAHLIERFRLGGQMHSEEARMNKALLNEIARKKSNSKTPEKEL